MNVVKSKLGCKLPRRKPSETKSSIIYRIGGTTFYIPAEHLFTSGKIKKKISQLLMDNPSIANIQKLNKLGVSCTKIS